jgi:hypothetical protein
MLTKLLSKLRPVLACLACVLSMSTAGRSVAETFRNPLRLPTLGDPTSIVVADFNGDSVPDILWGDPAYTTMHSFLSQPGGGYLPGPAILSGGVACVAADYNQDGMQDLACSVGSNFNQYVYVLFGKGDGTFAPAIVTNFSTQQYDIYAYGSLFNLGDVNHDGFPDLLLSEEQAGPPHVLLSDGKGGFKTTALTFAGGGPPFVADINGDGKPDILWPYGPEVSLGNGDGTFQGAITYGQASNYYAVCTFHDMDGDSHLDAVCGYPETITGDITGATDLVILHGNPDGSFNTTPIAHQIFGDHNNEFDGYGTFLYPAAVFDLNGDGIPDILAPTNDGMGVLLGSAGLTFSIPSHYALSVVGSIAANSDTQIADLNGDGIVDLVCAGPNGVYLLYGQHNGSFASALAPEVTEVIGYSTVADFNGDGIPDIAATGDTAIKLSLGLGDGTFAKPIALPNNAGAVNFSTPLSTMNAHIAHGDFNGDGKQDIIAIGSSSIYEYDYYLLLGNGDGTFQAPILVPNSTVLFAMYAQLFDAAVFDINRDGRSDLIAMGSDLTTPGQITSYLSNGNGSFSTVTTSVPTDLQSIGSPASNSYPAVADFNGDGILDVAYGSLTHAYFLKGHGDGAFDSSATALSIPSPGSATLVGPLAVAPGDFDGDGHQDFVLLAEYSGGQYPGIYTVAAWVYYGDGNGGFSTPVLIGTYGREYTGIASADLNRDGLSDIILKTSGSLGNGYAVGIVHGQPGRTFGPEINYTAGTGLASLDIADLNRDGFPDLVFGNGDYNLKASSVTVLLNLGNTPAVTGSLIATPEPSTVDSAFYLTATLTPPVNGQTLTGNVTFAIDGNTVGNVGLGNNAATLLIPTPSLSAGLHQISATWPGNSTYPAVALTGNHTVTLNPVALALSSKPYPSTFGQSVTFTAVATQTQPTAVNHGTVYSFQLTGTLSFYDGTTLLTTVQPGYPFTFSSAILTVGSHNITAVYSGDPIFAAATSNIVVQVVTALPTTSTLTISPATSVYGTSVTLTATVVPTTPPGPSAPAGTVTFYNGTTALGTTSLNTSGVAMLMLSTLPTGLDNLTCTYSGSAIYAVSNCNTVPATVTVAPTSLTISSSLNPAPALTPVTFTMQLSINGQPAGAGYPITLTGQPGCTANTAILLYGTPVTDATGKATVTTTNFVVGNNCLQASFAGDANDASANAVPSPLVEVVTALPLSLTLTAVPNPGYFTQTVQLNATVPDIAGTRPTYPTGTVTFLDAGAPIGTAALNTSGAAILLINTLAIGTHPLTATFAATGSFTSATSNTVQEVIVGSGFAIALAPPAITVQAGQPSTVQIVLSSLGNFSGPLALTYGQLPTYATASIAPTTVTLTAGGAGTAVLTLNTSARAAADIPNRPGRRALPITLAAGLLLLPRRRQLAARRKMLAARLLTLLLAAIVLQSLTGCVNAWYELELVTPGAYQVPITATDVNHNTQTAILNVTVIQ